MVRRLNMADDLRAFDGWFPAKQWPSAPCPICKLGDLHPINGSITTVNTTSYDRHENDEDWEPDWKHGFFHGVLFCARPACREKVIVSGEYRVSEDKYEWHTYHDELRLKYAIPALPLAMPPKKTPDTIIAGIEIASRIVWADPASAANALRRSVEALLDHQGVNKTRIVNGRRVRMSTHQRILVFKSKQPTAATSIEAVKWLGNEGSHRSFTLTATHCVESAEYLNHALRTLYDTSDAELYKKARAINKAKGLGRSHR